MYEELRTGLRGNKEGTRDEFVLVLANLISQCREKHTLFSELYLLSNEADPEVDFWTTSASACLESTIVLSDLRTAVLCVYSRRSSRIYLQATKDRHFQQKKQQQYLM